MKNIIRELKSDHMKKEKDKKTYKIDADVVNKFYLKCDHLGLKYSHVVERLMKEFIK